MLLPLFSIGIEYATAEEYVHVRPKPFSLLILPECCLEYVFDDGRIRADVDERRITDDTRGPRRAVTEITRDVDDHIMETMEVPGDP